MLILDWALDCPLNSRRSKKAMSIGKARANAERLGFQNVGYLEGDISQTPVTSNLADVVVSNCVLNLAPDKKSVFQEIRAAAEMYAGCSGSYSEK
jgi:hypothetical protein